MTQTILSRAAHAQTAAASLLLLLSTTLTGLALAGPTQVRVEQNSDKSFDVGPAARSTFELVEEYRPLSTAFNQQNKPRAFASSLSKGPARRVASPAQILVDFGGSAFGVDDNTNIFPQQPQQQQQQQGRSNRLRDLNTIPAHINNNNNINTPMKSHWMEWTRWSACANGERIRIRQCLEVERVKCEGESVERHVCYHSQSQVPVARDPLIIEREILGLDQNTPIRKF